MESTSDKVLGTVGAILFVLLVCTGAFYFFGVNIDTASITFWVISIMIIIGAVTGADDE